MKNINIVQKLLLDISTDGDEDAYSIPAEWQAYFHETLYPAMEKVFSKYNEGKIIRIDSLTIDVGDCSKEEFADLFLGQLTEQLDAHLHSGYSSDTGDAFHLNIVAPEKPKQYEADRGSQEIPEALFYFLKTGLLPWYFSSASQITPNQLAEDFLKMSDQEDLRNDFVEILQSPFVLQRLLMVFSPAISFRLLQWLLPAKDAAGLSLIRILLSIPGAAEPGSRVFHLLEKLTFNLLYPVNSVITAAFKAAIAAIHKASKTEEGEKRSRKAILATLKAIDSGTGFSIVQVVDHWSAMLNPASVSEDIKKIRSSLRKKEDEPNFSPQPELAEIDKHSSEYLTESLAAEGINIENAGLVLLHPFLPRFFKVLNLVSEEGDFINDAARIKAAQILHFLISGNTKTPEPSLILNKIFCGLDALAPVPAKLKPTAAIRKESRDLLTAFTENWQTISASTTDGLLNSFIRRPGILKQGPNGWLVQVEKKSYDILLDRLPWGIGLIRFRWMDYSIETEWNY